MEMLGRALMVLGAVVFAIGLLVSLFPSIPILGKLPGDIRIEKESFRLYIPVTTCVLLSLLLSLLVWLVSKFWKVR
jgi:uncharacterized membrane protein